MNKDYFDKYVNKSLCTTLLDFFLTGRWNNNNSKSPYNWYKKPISSRRFGQMTTVRQCHYYNVSGSIENYCCSLLLVCRFLKPPVYAKGFPLNEIYNYCLFDLIHRRYLMRFWFYMDFGGDLSMAVVCRCGIETKTMTSVLKRL